MNKVFLLLSVLLLGTGKPDAQRLLGVEQIFPEKGQIDLHTCNDRHEAKIVVYCDVTMDLDFSVNHETIISLEKTDLANERSYSIILPTINMGSTFDHRELYIYAEGYAKYPLFLGNLADKELRRYRVSDPYTKLSNPYYKYMENGLNLFSDGMYTDARVQYVSAMECPEYEVNKEEIDNIVASIDSILIWRDAGDNYLLEANYKEANKYYQKIFRVNTSDQYVKTKLQECSISYTQNCFSYFNMAEDLFRKGDYKKAKDFYQKVVDGECTQSIEANNKLIAIDNYGIGRIDKSSFVTYEFNKYVPIGFSIGACKMKKFSGYFTLRTNADIFKSIQSNDEYDLSPEVNVSFGWTKKIYAPVWLFFGPGYTGVGEYRLKKDAVMEGKEPTKDDYKLHWGNAVSPEIGIIVKYWHVNLKYTFQYRFPLVKADQDYMGKTRHYIGIGVAW